MKKTYLGILFFICMHALHAQKTYVWYPSRIPEFELDSQSFKDLVIDVIIKDTRVIPPRSKVYCSPEELEKAVLELLTLNFPHSKVNKIEESNSANSSARVVVTITLKSYFAKFSSPLWYGQTGFEVKVTNRFLESNQTESKEIEWITRENNWWGYKSARKALQYAFDLAAEDLVNFISQTAGKY